MKNLPDDAGDVRDLWSVGTEDPLEEEMPTDSSILARSMLHGQRSLAGYSPCDHRLRCD